jgi:hypothetical protein
MRGSLFSSCNTSLLFPFEVFSFFETDSGKPEVDLAKQQKSWLVEDLLFSTSGIGSWRIEPRRCWIT